MANKILIVNSLDKNSDYKDKDAVDNYIKLAIESGSLVKINYVSKEVQDFYRACIDNEVYEGKIDPSKVRDYINDYQSSTKILMVDENGYSETLLNFPKETTDFVLKDDINKDDDSWLDFGGVKVQSENAKKSKKYTLEKTMAWSMLFAILPYMYFIVNYSRRFTSVLTIATLWSVGILIYQVAKKKSNILNYAMAGIFVFVWGMRLVNPYWINSIAAIFITLGISVIFLGGEFWGEGILSLYYSTSQRKHSDYPKYTIMWLVALGIILASIIYFGKVGFVDSVGLLLLAWIITSVNLKGCEVEIIDQEEDLGFDNLHIESSEINDIENSEVSEENKEII